MTNFRDEAEKILQTVKVESWYESNNKDLHLTIGSDAQKQALDALTALHEREVERIIGEDVPTGNQFLGNPKNEIGEWLNELRAEQRRRANGEGEE